MKKRSIKSYADLPPQLVKQIDNEYPYGFDEELFEVKTDGKSKSYKAMWFETDEVLYLIKFDKYLHNRAKDIIKSADRELEMEEVEPDNIKLEEFDEEDLD